jgi:LuxR family transcriptional regulator, maltose regulon positive regulatory protein
MKANSRPRRLKPMSLTLERPRLLEQLEQADDKPLIALLAPAGYGKTTLLKQHTERSRRKTAWLTLREDAADANMLARDTIYALQEVIPTINFPQTREALEIGARANRLGVTLARDLNAINANLNVVFDRIEHLSTSSSSLVEALVEELGEGHQVLMAGYEGNVFPILKFKANGLALLIEMKHLSFTPQEIRELLVAFGFEQDNDWLYESTKGWPLGSALIARETETASKTDNPVIDLVNRLPQETRVWLTTLAPLDLWNTEYIKKLGCEVPHNWVSQIFKAGLPITEISPGFYEPHSLLVTALRDILFENSEQAQGLYTVAAQVAEQEHQIIKAIHFYKLAGLLEIGVATAERYAFEFSAEAQDTLAAQILDTVPFEKLSVYAKSMLAFHWLDFGDVQRAEKIILDLYESGEANPFLFLGMGRIEYKRGNSVGQLDFAERIFDFDLPNPLKVKTLILQSAAYQRLGKFSEDLKVSKEAFEIAQATRNYRLVSIAASGLTWALADTDDIEAFEAMFLKTILLLEKTGSNLTISLDYFNMAGVLCGMGDLIKARKYINDAILISKKYRDKWMPLILCGDAEISFFEANYKIASEKFEKATKMLNEFGFLDYELFLLFFKAQLNAITGEKEDYLETLKLIKSKIEYTSSEDDQQLILANAIYEFSLGSMDDVKFVKICDTRNTVIFIRANLYIADLERRKGVNWRLRLKKIIEKFDNSDKLNLLKVDYPMLYGLYEDAMRSNFYRKELQAAFSEKKHNIENFNLSLDIKTINKLEFRLKSINIKIGLQKARELLLWLAIQGPSSRTEIIKALWGEETLKSREYFKISVRKLRTSLFNDTSIYIDPLPFENNLYQLHHLIKPRWDFKSLLQRFHMGEWTQEDLEIGSHLPSTFLMGLKSDWIQEFKRGVFDSTHNALLNSAKALNLAQAAAVYEAAIALDPLSAEAYAGLARALQQSGRADEVALLKGRFNAAMRE